MLTTEMEAGALNSEPEREEKNAKKIHTMRISKLLRQYAQIRNDNFLTFL